VAHEVSCCQEAPAIEAVRSQYFRVPARSGRLCSAEIDTVHNTRVDYRPHATVLKIEPPIPNTEFRRDVA